MSRAATLIQNQFRSYCEHKRFKKSQEVGTHSSVNFSLRGSREATPIPTLKRTYSQRRQHQAARKIQQFMRQTKQNSIWDLLTDKTITERTSTCSRKRESGPGGTGMSGSGSSPSTSNGSNSNGGNTGSNPVSPSSPGGPATSPATSPAAETTGGPLIGGAMHHPTPRPFTLQHSPCS